MYMGKMCFGPSVGPNVPFVRADRWVRKWPRLDPEEAQRELVRRFLRTYGPTTLDGIARWFGMKPATLLPLLRSLEPEAGAVTIEGRKAWTLSRERSAARRRASWVRLLAKYDCYVIASHRRDTVVADAPHTRIWSFTGARGEELV